MLNIGLGICLAAEAVVYEPFAGVDNTLPSDKTFEENFGYKAELSYPQLSSDQRTIGGGAAYYCPYCGAPLDPHDHTELVRHGGYTWKSFAKIAVDSSANTAAMSIFFMWLVFVG